MSPRHERSSRFTSARCSAAACCSTIQSSIVPIVSSSPRSATCALPALPTCSSPCWETSRAIPAARHKEQPDEYSIERRTRVLRRAENRARGHVGDPSHVLVDKARIVGEPLYLYRASGGRRRAAIRLPDRLDWICREDGGPGAENGRADRPDQLCRACDHGNRFCREHFLQSGGAARRTPRPQHSVLEVAAGFRPDD